VKNLFFDLYFGTFQLQFQHTRFKQNTFQVQFQQKQIKHRFNARISTTVSTYTNETVSAKKKSTPDGNHGRRSLEGRHAADQFQDDQGRAADRSLPSDFAFEGS
tara:strand:+ start:1539 stop:1850 length:312 start_codon:yes stop_codon:yes gene_type:complete